VRSDQGDVKRLEALEGCKRITAHFDGIVTARETDIGAQQPRHRGLSLMILGEHETAQLRPEMAIEALRQRRRHNLAVRGQPALALKVDDMRMQHQLLNHGKP
jgi:hypothetical protein